MEQKFFLSDTFTLWGHNCANPIVPSHAKSNSFYKYVPLRIKIKVVFSPLSADDSSGQNPFFFFFPLSNLCPTAPAWKSWRRRMERRKKRGGSSCFYPYLITLHPLSPYRPTCQMPFPGILIPEGECVGREHKGILSVIVRSPLNNKLINLMGMTSHTSIRTQV